MTANGERRSTSEGRRTKALDETRLSDYGISYDQSSNWQRIADLSDDEFEMALAQDVSTSHMVEMAKEQPRNLRRLFAVRAAVVTNRVVSLPLIVGKGELRLIAVVGRLNRGL
jgi:hypothetical protein